MTGRKRQGNPTRGDEPRVFSCLRRKGRAPTSRNISRKNPHAPKISYSFTSDAVPSPFLRRRRAVGWGEELVSRERRESLQDAQGAQTSAKAGVGGRIGRMRAIGTTVASRKGGKVEVFGRPGSMKFPEEPSERRMASARIGAADGMNSHVWGGGGCPPGELGRGGPEARPAQFREVNGCTERIENPWFGSGR